MEPLVFLIGICLCAVMLMLFLADSEGHSIHEHMVKDSCSVTKKGTFEDFVRQFVKAEMVWGGNDPASLGYWPKSFFSKDHKSKWHASIIEFNGVGMLLNKTDWEKANSYIRYKIREEEIKADNLTWS